MIQISDIKKTYASGDNKVEALKGVSINFRENEFVSILGQSGCGKTTLLNILGGLDRYDSGDIVINNKSTKEFKDKDWDTYRNHYIGFIFQSYNLIPHLNVLENVEIALTIAGLGKKEKRELAVKALTRVGLFDQLKKKPNQLSGGQMQRVAIARAIVNNPKIILADEPTGALDSETSIQIMDLLKEIAGDHLIIMVTHNKEIADKYSSRIINLLDGEVVGDTNPYNPSKKEKIQKNDKKTQKNKSSMGFFTAFMLSLKNLISKKGRTFMTSFAGSIGIIGIALVLAVSNGFTSYIGKVQSDALGNYPLTVCAISMDMNKFTSTDTKQDDQGDEDVDDDMITPYNPLTRFVQYGHYNNITTEFVNKVKEYEEQDKLNGSTKLNAVNYNYYLPIKFITKNSNNEYKFIKKQNSTSILSADTSSAMNPMLDNVDFCLEQYDIIYGSLPQKQDNEPFTTQMLLVVGKGNKIPFSTLAQIGIDTPTDEMEQYEKLSIADIVEKEYKLVLNDDYYTPNAEELENITSFSKLDITSQTELETAYQNATYTCKICGVLRLKDDASEVLKPGLVYMQDFEEFYAQSCKNSIISQKEELNRQNGNYTLYDPYEIQVAEIEILPPFGSVQAINFFLQAQYGYSLSSEEAFELALQQIGTSKIPVNIKFYPKNFAAKKEIISLINDYNSTKDNENQKIVYSDASEFLTSTLGQLVEIISYVLIAFAAISLIVSSIMISIITYVSVIERTKEIGVLRSIGARKKDITRVFNAETLIIGMLAGLLGVLVSYLLSIPINAIIISVAGGAITSNIAVLAPLTALILIAISIILTVLAGFVPAIMASKQDPVKALRTE